MFFIRGMVTGKWICFYAVHKVTDNTKIDEIKVIQNHYEAFIHRSDGKNFKKTSKIKVKSGSKKPDFLFLYL